MRSLSLLGLAVLLGVSLAACGPIGGTSKKPTKTAAVAKTRVASPNAAGSPHAILASPAADHLPVGTPTGTPVPAPPPVASPPAVPTPTKVPSKAITGAGAASAAASGTPTPPTASGCTAPNPLPPVALHGTLATTDAGVRLHSGPGESCAVVDTLDTGTQLTAESGPVRSGQLLWIKVNVNGEEGWLAAEFVGPAGSAPATATTSG